MVDWPETYRMLRKVGYLDRQIADAARVRREVVGLVRNNKYPYDHQPTLEGAYAIGGFFKHGIALGRLTEADAKRCGVERLLV